MKLNDFLFLINFLSISTLICSITPFTYAFKCTSDGLFEDDNDCTMYYECLWIGTPFEKQEHLKCAERLIYNPRKHRCDNLNEFENQFASGVQTGEELLEFMRFRNCIGSKYSLNPENTELEEDRFAPSSTESALNLIPQIVSNDTDYDRQKMEHYQILSTIEEINRYFNTNRVNVVKEKALSEPIKIAHKEEKQEIVDKAVSEKEEVLNEGKDWTPKKAQMNQNARIIANKEIVDDFDKFNTSPEVLLSTTISSTTQSKSSSTTVKSKKMNKNSNERKSVSLNSANIAELKNDLNEKQGLELGEQQITSNVMNNKQLLSRTQNSTKHQLKGKLNQRADDFDAMFLLDDEKIYFGKKTYLDTLKNKTNKTGFSVEKVKEFKHSNRSMKIIGAEKKRAFFKTFDKTLPKTNAAGVHTTKLFLIKKAPLDQTLEKLAMRSNKGSIKTHTNSGKVLKSNTTASSKPTLEIDEEIIDKPNINTTSVNTSSQKVKNNSFMIFGKNLLNDMKIKTVSNAKKEKIQSTTKLANKMPTFQKRRLLSIEDNELETYSTEQIENEEEDLTTVVDDEEIESTDSSFVDKDEVVHEFANKVINELNSKSNSSNPNSPKKSSNLIDSIEHQIIKTNNIEKTVLVNNQTRKVLLSKDFNTTNYVQSTTETMATDDGTSREKTAETTQNKNAFPTQSNNMMLPVAQRLVGNNDIKQNKSFRISLRKPLKLVKALPKVNYSALEFENQEQLDKLNKLLIHNLNKRKQMLTKLNSNKFSYSDIPKLFDSFGKLKLVEKLNKPSEDKKEKTGQDEYDEHFTEPLSNLDNKNISTIMPSTPIPVVSTESLSSSSTSTTLSTSSSSSSSQASSSSTTSTQTTITTDPPTSTLSTPVSSVVMPAQTDFIISNRSFIVKTSFTKSPSAQQSTSFISPSKSSKPFMQTYRINQTKKLPNQFASLTLNYDNRSPIHKIDELEKGGKFQRLRVVPADTLIECKENDFGLECSCSITLSPPKCKQLINSFLSSCRILGCKNNGRCINMAYKYPIPYVCSCPSGFMGSYCEIPRKETLENDNVTPSVPFWKVRNSQVTKIPLVLTERPTPINKHYTTVTRDYARTTKPTTTSKNTFIKTNPFKEPLCEPNPCLNNGKCVITGDRFLCKCANSSFTGKYCERFTYSADETSKWPLMTPNFETSIVRYQTTTPKTTKMPFTTSAFFFWQCPSNCLNNLGHGYCTLSTNGYPKCVCQDQWSGIDCSQRNFCFKNSCLNNATCLNYPEAKSYLCLCPKGFSGRMCEINMNLFARPTMMMPQKKITNEEIKLELVKESLSGSITKMPKNPCLTQKCKNNGTCVMSFSHAKNKFSFVCKCEPGFYGALCEKKENPCNPNPCKAPLGECIAYSQNKYECVCGNHADCLYVSSTTPSMPVFEKTDFYTNLDPSLLSSGAARIYTTTKSSLVPSDRAKQVDFNQDYYSSKEKEGSYEINSREKDEIYQENKIFKQKPLLSVNMANTKTFDNPCLSDENLCLKYPYGNESFICVKSFLSQDYTLCLPTKSMNCKESNPCLNGGICTEGNEKNSFKCLCPRDYTGRLCETEICAPVHKLFANHTMCQADSPNLIDGSVSKDNMDLILDMHNTLRRQVAPIASNMQKMYWDVRLQHLAQKRAQLCSVENTGILMRQQPGYGIVIGENLAAGYDKWSHVLNSWMSESRHFIYKSTSQTDNLQAGHYTQMIYSSASRIGCGFAQCSNTTYDRYFVCYYGEMQTYFSRYEPYKDGKQCSACENNCDKGLCDCKGAFCSNGGTMDLRTCTCKCPYSTFTGRYCENVVCPKEDSPFCSHSLFEDKCWLYPVVRATCPYMCSLCTKYSQSSNATISYTKPNDIESSKSLKELMNILKHNN